MTRHSRPERHRRLRRHKRLEAMRDQTRKETGQAQETIGRPGQGIGDIGSIPRTLKRTGRHNHTGRHT